MKKIANILLVTVCAMSLTACNGEMNKQGGGTLIGAGAGGLLGSQFGKGGGQLAAIGIGALAGAMIGNQIGKTMDEHDKMMMLRTSNQALEFSPSGSSVGWNNPDSGNHGTITPMRTYRDMGQYCREYQQEIVVGGQKQKAYGKACRQNDGQWKIAQ